MASFVASLAMLVLLNRQDLAAALSSKHARTHTSPVQISEGTWMDQDEVSQVQTAAGIDMNGRDRLQSEPQVARGAPGESDELRLDGGEHPEARQAPGARAGYGRM